MLSIMSKSLNPVSIMSTDDGVEIHLPSSIHDLTAWDSAQAIKVFQRLEVMLIALKIKSFLEENQKISGFNLGMEGNFFNALDGEETYQNQIREFGESLTPYLNELNKPFIKALRKGGTRFEDLILYRKDFIKSFDRAAYKVLGEISFMANVQRDLDRKTLQEEVPPVSGKRKLRRI